MGQVRFLLFLAVFAAATAAAGDAFPGRAPDREVIKTQEKVDSLFERGKYERALFIYQKELAPLGDKYAQYMVGYMHLAGKGVDVDLPTATAWYRLAAERGQETFVREHDKLVSLLDAGQRARADEVYTTLHAELGDAVLLARLIELDLDSLSGRVRDNPFSQDAVSKIEFDRQEKIHLQTSERIRSRIRYLETMLEDEATGFEFERQRLADLQLRAEKELNDFEEGR